MRKKTVLSPHGTALMQLGMAELKTPRFPRALAQAVRESDLGEESLYLAWELTRQAAGATPEEQEALLVTILASLVHLRQGSTCLPIGGEAGKSYLKDLFDTLGAKPELADTVLDLLHRAQQTEGTYTGNEILGRPGDYKPLILEGEFLYHQRLLDQENRVAERLSDRLEASTLAVDESQLDTAFGNVLNQAAVVDEKPIQLSTDQQKAVRTAARRSLTAISGGPGTGKTSVVVSILRVLVRLGVNIESVALAAPTGKAAHRMQESIEVGLLAIPNRSEIDDQILRNLPETKTLHRLLGYSPRSDGFRHHENNPLAEQVVIVNEASMIDLELMDRLLRAVPKDVRLILLGDADQLPSVEAGAVFRDLLPAKDGAQAGDRRNYVTVVLTESYRTNPNDPAGRNIQGVAAHINAGRGEALFDPNAPEDETVTERSTADDLAFSGVELLAEGDKPIKKNAFLERWFTDRVTSYPRFREWVSRNYVQREDGFDESDTEALLELFRHTNSHKILCVTTYDTEYVNHNLHQKMAGKASRGGMRRSSPNRSRFYPGESVMMLRNDYERGLFNGDQGLILRVTTEAHRARPMVVFPAKASFAAYSADTLGPDITLSFALTVHKSQGSEFDDVGVILPGKKIPILTREILYTATTRSRRSVVILGSQELLLHAVGVPLRRYTGIERKIQRAG